MRQINDYILEKLFIGKGFTIKTTMQKFMDTIDESGYKVYVNSKLDNGGIPVNIQPPKQNAFPYVFLVLFDDYWIEYGDEDRLNFNKYFTKDCKRRTITVFKSKDEDLTKNACDLTIVDGYGYEYTHNNAEIIIDMLNNAKH